MVSFLSALQYHKRKEGWVTLYPISLILISFLSMARCTLATLNSTLHTHHSRSSRSHVKQWICALVTMRGFPVVVRALESGICIPSPGSAVFLYFLMGTIAFSR